MSLSPGTVVGTFEILARIGAGGMGEVYKARDVRLGRTVALKIISPDLAADPERRARFEREARAASALQHPHICTLHDFGSADGVDFLVLEYLEGETVAERLTRGPLPIEEVLRVGSEVASGLERAHRAGIVHRDLKPGNVMLTKTGSKLLDFGLAKLRADGGPAGGTAVSGLATRTAPESLTGAGTLLGTLPYMAPEQLEGHDEGPRTDIWALGALLYEMATGRAPFEGRSPASLIAAILGAEPRPMVTLLPLAPPALERLVSACLNKDPAERIQSAHDAGQALRWIRDAALEAAGRERRGMRIRERLAWALAAAAVIVMGVMTIRPRAPVTKRQDRIESTILAPANAAAPFGWGFALSPDGRQLVFTALAEDGRRLLWIRSIDGTAARTLSGTNGAMYPFWSPDGSQIGFFSHGRLRRIAASGGAAQTVCDVPTGTGGTWNRDGVIVYATWAEGTFRVPASGGVPVQITRLDPEQGEIDQMWPSFLPDDRHFLFVARRGGRLPRFEVVVGDINAPGRVKRLAGAWWSGAAYAAPGYLLFRPTEDASLFAQRFDTERLELTGARVPVTGPIGNPNDWAPFSVSQDGRLVFLTGAPGIEQRGWAALSWFDRSGKGPIGPSLSGGWTFRLSHSGRRVAITPDQDLWLQDVSGAAPVRLTSHPGIECCAIWSPDDRALLHVADSEGALKVHSIELDSSTTTEWAAGEKGEVLLPSDWSRDSRYVLFMSARPGDRDDLVAYATGDRKRIVVAASPFAEGYGLFSADVSHVVYVSDESGEEEIYVRPFPGPGEPLRVSREGGTFPRWRSDGRELFYMARDGYLMAVPVAMAGGRSTHGTPERLFRLPLIDPIQAPYDVAPDGRRFLVIVPDEKAADILAFVQNWHAGLPPGDH